MNNSPVFSGNEYLFKSAFDADDEIQKYHPNALTIFTLALYLRLDDISEFAADAITEGKNDKKVDICYLDYPEKKALIAQSYFSTNWGKNEAPANKASDLNTAIAWLLSASETNIPKDLKTKALELRKAISNGDVNRIEILFIHNCFESINVDRELKTVADATRDNANSLIKQNEIPLVVSYKEFGVNEIEELYRSRDSEILIDDWIDVPANEFLPENGKDWNAILATVPGNWISGLFKKHGDRLFSANFRDYMGAASRKGNINFGIKQTAESEPTNFWVYNNGITALTHEIDDSRPIRIRGISVINGAQTSGALGETLESAATSTKVLIRIVECKSKELVDKIIRYNNTQNEIKPADRRSNDQVQTRLKIDFAFYGITYVHRRSATRTPRNAINAAAIGSALCAFHGNPQTSYRNPTDIFNDDTTYNRVFPNNLKVEHVYLIKSLSTAIDSVKSELKSKVASKSATQLEERQYDILKYSTAKHFLFYVLGFIAEELMAKRISDLHEWKCKVEVISLENISLANAWLNVLSATLPHMATLMEEEKFGKDAAYEVPRSMEKSRDFAKDFKALIASKERQLKDQFEQIRKRSTV